MAYSFDNLVFDQNNNPKDKRKKTGIHKKSWPHAFSTKPFASDEFVFNIDNKFPALKKSPYKLTILSSIHENAVNKAIMTPYIHFLGINERSQTRNNENAIEVTTYDNDPPLLITQYKAGKTRINKLQR